MKTFTIKKGSHYSNLKFPKLLFSATKIVEKITFNENCRYDLKSEDQLDVNKLLGIGYLPTHHHNSARFGWRYDNTKEQIEILAYWYKDKTRFIESMAFIDINKTYTYSIEINKDTHNLILSDANKEIASFKIELSSNFIGYYLKPYFGGNRTAPHLMTITFY